MIEAQGASCQGFFLEGVGIVVLLSKLRRGLELLMGAEQTLDALECGPSRRDGLFSTASSGGH